MADNKSDWLSLWPEFFPRQKRERVLSFLDGAYLVSIDGEIWKIESYLQLKEIAIENRLEIYVQKFLGDGGFVYFREAVDDNAVVNIANSSQTITSIVLIGARNRQAKIVSCGAWGWRRRPDMNFLNSLKSIFDMFDYGIHPSPGSLGTNGVRQTIADTTRNRYKRPGNKLRKVLFEYGFGGRADDFSEDTEYPFAYEFDFDSHYANVALGGVPVDEAETIGLYGIFRENIDFLSEYKTCLCECKVTVRDKLVVSPIYIRGKDGKLQWVTEPGEYYGYYWTEMIRTMVQSGCKVEVGVAWCWKELDKFLNTFIEKALKLRNICKEKGLKVEEGIVKHVIVSTFGSFGMRPFRYRLVTSEQKQDGDEPFLNLDNSAAEGLSTGYFIREEKIENSPKLTQVMYYIIMLGAVEIYKRLIEEMYAGNILIASNYDAVTTVLPPMANTSGGKVKQYRKYKQLGLRSYKHAEGEVRPGVQKNGPQQATSVPSSYRTATEVFRQERENGRDPEKFLGDRMEKRLHGKSIRTGL